MLEILKNHRTIRKYQDRCIDQNVLHRIIEVACRASTTGNMQLYSVINTTGIKLKHQLAPAHFNQKMIMDAPNVLTFCADFNRFNKWCKLRDAIPGYENLLSFANAAIDALLVAQNVCVAAESEGLGICYLGTTIYNADKIIEVLNLPKGVIPITTVTIGWPAENPEQVDRLPLKGILHNEQYHDYSENDIDNIYAHKESLKESLSFIKENNKNTLAQVFTDVRYKKSDNEFFSDKLIAVLKQQGFLS